MDVYLVILLLMLPFLIFLWLGWDRRRKERRAVHERIASAGARFDHYDKRALSEVSSDGLNLQNDEQCYFSDNARLLGYRTVRGTAAYHGPVVRVPIAKGISYRAAVFSGGVESRQEIRPLADGKIYLTNKRVIFRGDRKNNSVGLSKILEMTYFYGDNSIRIDKDNGPPIILDGFNGELFWYIYKRVSTGRLSVIDDHDEWRAQLGEVDLATG